MEPNVPPGTTPEQVVTAQAVPEPPRQAVRQGPKLRGCLTLFFSLFAFIAVPALLLTGYMMGNLAMTSDEQVEEQYHSLNRSGDDKIAIISVEGTILDGDGFVKRQIDRVKKDDDVKAVVVRVDSPGGTVTGSDFIYHHLTRLRKESGLPLVVSMGGIAASGGYYVSMAVGDTKDTIFAEPTTWTGSIGVIIPHYNVAGLMERYGVESDSIASHRLKGMGSITKDMTEEEKEIFQGLVDESFKRFKEVIKSGRPEYRTNESKLDELATGQVFTTEQAIKGGLVDKEGFIEAAIDRAIELADLDRDEVKVVKYKEPLSLGDVFLGMQSKQPSFDLSALLDLASPRAYYLFTTLPTLRTR